MRVLAPSTDIQRELNRNLSTAGVALDVVSQVGIPEQFTLMFTRKTKSIHAQQFGARKNASGSRSISRRSLKSRHRDEAVAAFDTHTLRSPIQAEWKW
jgi:hypothetical protein